MDARKLALIGLLAIGNRMPAQAPISASPWIEEEVGVGVIWKRYVPPTWSGIPETIQVLEVDPKAADLKLKFVSPGKLTRTSVLGSQGGAVAAVNGNFFTKEARSTGILRIGGIDHGDPHPHRATGFVLGQKGEVDILDDPSTRFEKLADVMTAAPRLLEESKKPPAAAGWNKDRHPRTAVGMTKAGRVLFVTVDGRTPESKGMTFDELADLMLELNCLEALNLDGGGSTTLWVRNEPEGGIVNYPCDNKKHDRAGERAVANVILIHARDVIVLDTEEAILLPASAWRRSSVGRGILGLDYAQAEALESEAQWSTRVELPGRYALEMRWPEHTPSATLRVSAHDGNWTPRITAEPGHWQRMGELTIAEPGPLSIAVQRKSGTALTIDACRLVQLTK